MSAAYIHFEVKSYMLAKVARLRLAFTWSLCWWLWAETGLAQAALAPESQPSSTGTSTARLAKARDHLAAAEYVGARELSVSLTQDPAMSGPDLAEAYRVHGLASFFLGSQTDAEISLLAYLVREPEGHLDPAIYPPEAIVFFEDVRARHAGELIAHKPRQKPKRHLVLNFLPPLGQFQNGDRQKGRVLGAAELVLLGTNVTTYVLLRRSCSENDKTCGYERETARTLRTTNLVSGTLLLGLVLYGVVDGAFGGPSEKPRVALTRPRVNTDGTGLVLSLDF